MRAIFGLVLIVGLALAGGAVYMAQNYISAYQQELARERQAAAAALEAAAAENAAIEVIPTVGVIVSNRTLKYGERLAEDDVRVVEWPENAIPEGSFTDLAVLFPESGSKDRFVLRTMEKDEALMEVKITQPGEGAGLTSQLDKGMRAFAIRVDVASGVSGFLRPGDFVDVYWTGSRRGTTAEADGEITRLIQPRVELIAVDQIAGTDVTGTTIARTITVAVTREQVAVLTQAQNTGRLTLALVGIEDETVSSEVIEIDQRALLGVVEEEAAPVPERVEQQVCKTRIRRGNSEVADSVIACTN